MKPLRQAMRQRRTARWRSWYTQAGDRIVADGSYTVSVGGGQPGTDAASVSGTVQVVGRIQLSE
jgi:beta-glucosidase